MHSELSQGNIGQNSHYCTEYLNSDLLYEQNLQNQVFTTTDW